MPEMLLEWEVTLIKQNPALWAGLGLESFSEIIFGYVDLLQNSPDGILFHVTRVY